jgi:hypothetical protein
VEDDALAVLPPKSVDIICICSWSTWGLFRTSANWGLEAANCCVSGLEEIICCMSWGFDMTCRTMGLLSSCCIIWGLDII